MRIKQYLLVSICFLFIIPAINLLFTANRMADAYNSTSLLPEKERPAALINAVENVHETQYYGVLAYYLGIGIMVLLARRGYKIDSKILWYFAICTVGFICAQGAFYFGILTIGLLLWKRKYFKAEL